MSYPDNFEVDSVEEAVALAEQLRAKDEYNIFRGQTEDWPMRPGAIRLKPPQRETANQRMLQFAAFVEDTPELAAIHGKRFDVWGIAQHYGLPTTLLDFSTKPAVAGWFASHDRPTESERQSVIYLAHEEFIETTYRSALPQLFTVRIDVENLWRLQAQAGLFLHLPFQNDPEIDKWLAEGFGSIRFPYRGPMQGIPREAIYPARKSRLEILLDRFFTQELRIKARDQVEALGFHHVAIEKSIVEEPAEGFVGDVAPTAHQSWSAASTVAWRRPPPETFRRQDNPPHLVLEAEGKALNDAKVLEAALTQTLREFLAEQQSVRAGFANFRLRLQDSGMYLDDCLNQEARWCKRTVRQDLEDLWDGMRLFPYSDEVISRALGYLAAVWFQVHGRGRALYSTTQDLLGHDVLVEIGRSIDGQSAEVAVPISEFNAALRNDLVNLLKPSSRDLATHPDRLLHQVIQPERLFDFERFAELFGCRFVPFQFMLRKYQTIAFSPLDINRLGNR